ncbi:MAG: outer membrane protein assembly factor BamD [Deltaproteobacteria bacterium]|nr:outer membrane protein assembly factor BamD [Deltaproteobacteria bacterium]MBN2674276.1 outer membrane protein assembly factor BamD [Deltaproteobacteria bacterium]
MNPIKTNILLVLTMSIVCSCATTKTRPSYLDYSESARLLFQDATKAFDRERWTDAQNLFNEVKAEFPYSKYAPLAELRIADCSFELGSHAEAAVGYQHFIKLYPTHPEAHYAAFRKGESYYAQIPSDWFLTPPSFEKDQTATRDARAALGHFLRVFKDSKYVPKATELYEEVEAALIRHEMYVAEFYLKRDKKKAAAVRLESVERQFPNSPLIPDAMFLKAITLLEMGKMNEAKETFNDIINLYADHPQAKRAKKYLRAL